MFAQHPDSGYATPLPGIRQKTLVFGQHMLLTEFLLDRDRDLPLHTHPYEQTGYLVKGRMVLKIADTEHDVSPGDSWCIPMNIPHGAWILEDSVAIEVFSPPRADYLPPGE